jgi:hypothetical protein
MTPVEKLKRDIQEVQRSIVPALGHALKSGSPEQLAEVKRLIGSLAARLEPFIPPPANSN